MRQADEQHGDQAYDAGHQPVTLNSRGRRVLVVLGALAGLMLVIGLVGGLWLNRQLKPPGPVGPEVGITVPTGASTEEVGRLLEEAGVVDSGSFFVRYLRFTDAGAIQAGAFTLRQRADLAEVAEVLSRAPASAPEQRLTVPEGLTIPQVAEIVGRLPGRRAEAFMAAAASGKIRSRYQPADQGLEGLVLPETYLVRAIDTEAEILARMVAAFDDLAAELGIEAKARALGVTPHQAAVVASLVEREARVDKDRGPIARVIYNRLDRGMRLQIDATVQFALGVNKPRLLFKDLEVDSPYNTYRIAGLPPGPIANPGRAALAAALDPPVVPWIFYVLADADGSHAFAETGAEFERLKAASARKGLL
ncbi:MAG: endolytic transglycosylase MltG [Acidimicrobiales bacterium]